MSTIQDVAKEAKVSVATVSRVLNNSPLVLPDTKQSVLAAISTLNYQPNLLGRNLRRTETKMILVLLPTIANPFYSRLVKGMEDAAHACGYNIMLCNTDSDKNREEVYLELLKKRLADGVIFMAPEIELKELDKTSFISPTVQCCEYREGSKVSHVSIDNLRAAKDAVVHLIKCGYSRIGHISCKNNFVSTIQRKNGYKNALEEAGIPFDPELTAYGDYGFNSGYKAANRLLSLDKRPEAIFAISDIMAIGAIKAIREKGLTIPADISVMGFDDISFASMYDPPLSTVSQPKYELGKTAVELLMRQLDKNNNGPEDIILPHKLIIRGSTMRKGENI
jgi:LacI family transcriptional regulator, repressor for deo operon, udp, cdd, tsx, nupC, and nupG